jgi:hypothetical protein
MRGMEWIVQCVKNLSPVDYDVQETAVYSHRRGSSA